MSPHRQPSSAAFMDARISSLWPFSGGQILTNALSQRGDVGGSDERQTVKTKKENRRGKIEERKDIDTIEWQ